MTLLLAQLVLLTSLFTDSSIHWKTSLDPALEEARIRNAPVVVLLIDDVNPLLPALNSFYRSSKIAPYADRVVFLIGHKGSKHEREEKKIEGRVFEICSLYGVSCPDHERSFLTLQSKYIRGEYWFPMQIFLLPDGKESYRFQKSADGKMILAEIERALSAAGPGVASEEYRQTLETLKKIKNEMAREKREESQQRIRKLIKKGHPESFRKFLEQEALNLGKG